MPALDIRIAEIRELPWQQIRDLAESLGFDGKPDEDKSWADNAEAIAKAEVGQAENGETTKVDDSLPPAPTTPESSLRPIQGNHCPNCDQKIRTGLHGEPVCPALIQGCPRNK